MSVTIDHTVKLDCLQAMIKAKETWLAQHQKRPEWEVTLKRRELAILREIANDYREGAHG